MIREKTEPHISSPENEPDSPPDPASCQAHRNLNEWQVRQYRHAVNENKWYMSERLGRAVDWEEAEHDFLHNEYYGCAPKWRKEYCSRRCHHFTDCVLGQRFAKE
jgi:hypothetical protein